MIFFHWITGGLFIIPALGAGATAWIARAGAARRVALVTACLTLADALLLPFGSDRGLWLPMAIYCAAGFVIICSAASGESRSTRAFLACLLLCESAAMGALAARNLLVFFGFFELLAGCVFSLIARWGGPGRKKVALAFAVVSIVGLVLFAIALVGIGCYAGRFQIAGMPILLGAAFSRGGAHLGAAKLLFVLLMLAFMLRLPSVPLHHWLLDLHDQAPSPLGMLLPIAFQSVGGYGVFRVAYFLFPSAGKALWLAFAAVGVATCLFAALCALAQTDFKRLIAYHSIGQMGLALLGAAMMTPAGRNGAMFILVSQGLVSGMLFYVAGILRERAEHTELPRLAGVAGTAPLLREFTVFAILAGVGVPSTCGFVGQLLVMIGVFQAAGSARGSMPAGQVYTVAVLACIGWMLLAACMLRAMHLLLRNAELREAAVERGGLHVLSAIEVGVLAALAGLILLLGFFPRLFFHFLTL